MRTIINHPASLVSLSDGGAHVQFICDTCYPSHLLGYWVREKQAMSLEKAIQVLAAVPAGGTSATTPPRWRTTS